MLKAKNEHIRHGDINLAPADKREGAKAVDSFVIAEGETTGHFHKITGNVAVIEGDTSYVEVLETSTLDHPEHGVVVIEPGIYKTWKEKERDPYMGAIREVRD